MRRHLRIRHKQKIVGTAPVAQRKKDVKPLFKTKPQHLWLICQRAIQCPGSLTQDDAIQLQRSVGNQAVIRLIQQADLDGKTTFGRPGDRYEQEAHSITDEIMNMPDPHLQQQVVEDESLNLNKNNPVQTSGGYRVKNVTDSTGGEPLSESLRSYFEPRFGSDFGNVRIHRDGRASTMAQMMGARAFTNDNHIMFGKGQFEPQANEGKRLLAHELTHVLQQTGGYVSPKTGLMKHQKAPQKNVFANRRLSHSGVPDVSMWELNKTLRILNQDRVASAVLKKILGWSLYRFKNLSFKKTANKQLKTDIEWVKGFSDSKNKKIWLYSGLSDKQAASWLHNLSKSESYSRLPIKLRMMFSYIAQEQYNIREGIPAVHPSFRARGRMPRSNYNEIKTWVERVCKKDKDGILKYVVFKGEQKVGEIGKVAKRPYIDCLKEAVKKLKRVKTCRRSVGKRGRRGRIVNEKFDTKNWYTTDEYCRGGRKGQRILKMLPAKRPSEAVQEMFRRLNKWSFDCAEFVQVAHWYAMLKDLGPERFNDIMGGNDFVLRPNRSTGILWKEEYARKNKSDRMKLNGGREVSESVEQIIKKVPLGSRIVWENPAAPEDSIIRSENTIKVGKNAFAAHGLSSKKNIFSRAELENYLIKITARKHGKSVNEVKEKLFIIRIIVYERRK